MKDHWREQGGAGATLGTLAGKTRPMFLSAPPRVRDPGENGLAVLNAVREAGALSAENLAKRLAGEGPRAARRQRALAARAVGRRLRSQGLLQAGPHGLGLTLAGHVALGAR